MQAYYWRSTYSVFEYLFNQRGTEGACWRQAQEQFGRTWRRFFVDPFQPDYATGSVASLSGSAGGAVNLRDGTSFATGSVVQNDPRGTRWRPGGTASLGYIFGPTSTGEVNQFLGGAGNQLFVSIPTGTPVNAFFAISHSYGGGTALEFGLSSPGKLSGGVVPLSYSKELQR